MAVIRTIKLSEEMDRALLRAAEAEGRPLTEIIDRALMHFLRDAEEYNEDRERWESYLADRKTVSLEAVKEWVESWDSEAERPVPTE